jgi:hypothetical protein
MSLDLEDGSKFPDLLKAGLGKGLEDLVKNLRGNDQEFFQLAQDEKKRLRKQSDIDLKSFVQSQSGAIERGNQNACDSRHNFDAVAQDLARQTQPIVLSSNSRQPAQGRGKLETKLPRTNASTPTRGARSRPASIARSMINQSISPIVSNRPYSVQPVSTSNLPAKSKRNLTQFVRAHSGDRGTSIGDRAVVFSANGTPQYGDSHLDRNTTENLAANQATAEAPLTQIPSKVSTVKPQKADPLQQQPRANITPKSNSVANMAVLGGIAAAVTAVLFFFQYVLSFVQFILQVSSVTSTITNIASSFVAIMNNVGSLFGLGDGVVDPLSQTFESMLNNVFGKDKVDYVKFQFAKISSAYVAAQNLAGKLSGVQNSLGNVTEKNANNTSKIGNALKMMGMMSTGDGWMNENNKVATGIGGVGGKLDGISGLASSLTDVVSDVKTAKEQQETLDKEQTDREKADQESTDKAKEKHADPDVSDVQTVGGTGS